MDTFTRYVLPAGLAIGVAVALFFQAQGEAAYALFAWVGAGVFGCGWAIARSTRLGVLLTAIGCMGSNLYLLSRKFSTHAGPSLCTVNETINCDVINASSYSEMFGIPVTLFGAAFYGGLALAALRSAKGSPRFHQVNTLFAVLALIYSAYLALASVSIGAVCVMCISIYLGNILLLVAGVKGLRETGGQMFDDFPKVFTSPTFVTVTVVFAVSVLVGRAAWMGRGSGASAAQQGLSSSGRLAALYARTAGPVTLDGTEPVLGDPDAPYLIVEFADFACPHCAHAAQDFKQLVVEHPDIQVRFKAYPLSGACNPALEGDAGSERCVGAFAAECAHQQGKFWQMAGTIFANLGYLAPGDLEFMAGQVGLDLPAWRTCMEDPKVQEAILADVSAGNLAGVQGTPTLFLRGTHGDDFVLVTYTAADAVTVIDAHRAGKTLPPPGPAPLR